MLKRGVGEHNAKLGQVARDGRCEYEGVGRIAVVPANSPPAQQHDGADTAGEQIAFSIVDMAQAPGIGKTAYKSPAENAFAHAERAVKGKTVAAAGNRRQLAADFRGIFFRSAKPGFRFAHASP